MAALGTPIRQLPLRTGYEFQIGSEFSYPPFKPGMLPDCWVLSIIGFFSAGIVRSSSLINWLSTLDYLRPCLARQAANPNLGLPNRKALESSIA
jgi:hypothetical protein